MKGKGKRQVKKHAIIPIFIPHKGCPNDCVFCNQKKITAHSAPVTPSDVEEIIETWLSTLEPAGVPVIEAAFFGGSFTGIPLEEQSAYLSVAKKYKDAGRISKIHLSTRPDYINEEILDNLMRFDTDIIELGVQSFDDRVLKLSGRGHDSAAVYRAAELIKSRGLTLGIQLMIGLPGDSYESCVFSAEETVKIAPSIARLYPTVIIRDTALCDMYRRGSYMPLSEEEAVFRTGKMYRILDSAGIRIIRVGLKSSDIITDKDAACGGTFHPAFRQLVEGDLARQKLEAQISALSLNENHRTKADFFSNSKSFSNMVGHQGRNKKYFLEKYPHLNILYKVNNQLQDNQFQIRIKGDKL